MGRLRFFDHDVTAVVLDLDGTMIDAFPDVVAAANQLRQARGMRPMAYDEVIAHVGHGPEVLVKGVLPGLARQDVADAVGQFASAYEALRDAHSTLFDGVREFLQQSGVRKAVLTNKLERLARSVLQRFELTDYFEKICGFDTTGFRKPDGRALVWVLGALGVTPDQAVYIGDSDVDMHTAQAAGVPFVLVKTGLTHTLGREMPQIQVARLDELLVE